MRTSRGRCNIRITPCCGGPAQPEPWKRHVTRTHVLLVPAMSAGIPTTTDHQVTLPKLSIKPFNGEVCIWQEFWDQYEAAIHDNQDFSKTERFTYLKSYLVGSAARAVAGLKITDSNYDTAIDMLKKRFGRKDLVVSAHMSK